MFARFRLEFRPVLTICVVAALGVLVSLGTWQLHRLDWKRDLVARVETRVNAAPIPFEEAVRRAEAGEDMSYTPVDLSGEFLQAREARVFGAYNGVPGSFRFTPLRRASGAVVYVNRGFVPQTVESELAPTPKQSEIVGLFRYAERPSPPASWFRPTEQSADGLWFIRNPQLFAEKASIETAPYYVDQSAVPGQEWPKGGTTRLTFNNRHLEYALTWFGLALTLIGVWLAFSLKKR